jgi:hypothetical protein
MLSRCLSSCSTKVCCSTYPYLTVALGISYITLFSITQHNTQTQHERAITKELEIVKQTHAPLPTFFSHSCPYR